MEGCGLVAPRGADEKTPATRTARVWCREWVCVFLEEAKPASIMPGTRVEGRFVLSVVAMTGLTCVRRKLLLGRNLITLFECVNSFAELFSWPSRPHFPQATRVAPARQRTRIALHHARHASTFEKCRISCAFVAPTPVPGGGLAWRARISSALPRRLLPSKQAWKQSDGRALILAAHQPNCADLRELFLQSKTTCTPGEAGRHHFGCVMRGQSPGQDPTLASVLPVDSRTPGFCRNTVLAMPWRGGMQVASRVAPAVPGIHLATRGACGGRAAARRMRRVACALRSGHRNRLPDAFAWPGKETGRTGRPERRKHGVAKISDPRPPAVRRNRPAQASR